jgi:formylglycine-generating enzyme
MCGFSPLYKMNITRIPGNFVYDSVRNIITDPKNGIEYAWVPGGSMVIGMSDEEDRAAAAISLQQRYSIEDLRPAELRTFPDLLVSILPVQATKGLPQLVSIEDAEASVKVLGGRLPTTDEWEWFCRGGSTSLFWWGDHLGHERNFPALLGVGEDVCNYASNGYGLKSLFWGEWTSSEHPEPPARWIRGGGSYFWPWQDDEWVWCMSCMRFSSSLHIDGNCAFRVVIDLK